VQVTVVQYMFADSADSADEHSVLCHIPRCLCSHLSRALSHSLCVLQLRMLCQGVQPYACAALYLSHVVAKVCLPCCCVFHP
jgi:hypothetical protein